MSVFLMFVWALTPTGSDEMTCIAVPDVEPEVYIVKGDVMIGVIAFGRDYSSENTCGHTLSSSRILQVSIAVAYALEQLDKDQTVLPNISLGYVITEDCHKPQIGLARAVGFIQPGLCNITREVAEVAGVITATSSSISVASGTLLNLFKVPMIGAISTAELLSDKTQFEYFVRVVPSDRYQAAAMVAILVHFNWTYISTVHSEGSYGQDGIKAVHQLAEEQGICIAYSREIRRGADMSSFEDVARGLIQHPTARVVILFVQDHHGVQLMRAMSKTSLSGYFIFIGGDALGSGFDINGLEKATYGSFFIDAYTLPVPIYHQYFGEKSAADDNNPWIKYAMSTIYGCSWNVLENQSQQKMCDPNLKFKDTPFFTESSVPRLTIDAVNAFAYALHNYLKVKCPKAFSDKSMLKTCIKRRDILPFLYNVSFPSSTGDMLTFDKKGDAEGKYHVFQIQPVNKDKGQVYLKPVGYWDKSTYSLQMLEPTVWDTSFQNEQLIDIQGDKMGKSRSSLSLTPESVCSHPCLPSEFLIQLELKCCWECRKCRSNEIVTRNGTSCTECQLLTWPNQEDFLSCEPIEPSYLNWTDPQTLVCLTLAIFGLLLSTAMVILNYKYRHERLIKATSRELSMITLSGIIFSYLASILIISGPSITVCYIGRIAFSMSFSIAYAPLVAKVSRIHRIFKAARKGTKAPSFVSTRSQIVMTLTLISVQLSLSLISVMLDPPDVQLRMPMVSERFVEMLCALPVRVILFSLSYNLLLLVACTFLAFKARKLPDNFNESRFIFLCVCTTLFLWVAFIPSYFSAFYAAQKVLFLSMVLLLNSGVLLICLYLPRIYAVVYVEEDRQGVKTMVTNVVKVEPSAATSCGGSMEVSNSVDTN